MYKEALRKSELLELTVSEKFETRTNSGRILNTRIDSMRVAVTNFVNTGNMFYSLFEDVERKDIALKTMHEIKNKFGADKIIRAMEMTDGKVIKDVIGFGSVKDLTDLDYKIE